MMTSNKPICIICKRTPDEIEEYVGLAEEQDCAPEDVVVDEEGTYNPENGHFYCTECYTEIGMPLGVAP